MTANTESPYSSIFGRWCPWRASSTAKFVQAELFLHLFEFCFAGVAQGNPDETVVAFEIVADFSNGQIRKSRTVLVGNAV